MKAFDILGFDDKFFRSSFLSAQRQLSQYSISIGDHTLVETDDAFYLDFVLPGFKKDSISVELDKGYLVVKASPKEPREGTVICGSYPTIDVVRKFPVETPILEKKLSASYEDGVLKVTLPKNDSAKIKVEVK
jgi:HSP20 family protein